MTCLERPAQLSAHRAGLSTSFWKGATADVLVTRVGKTQRRPIGEKRFPGGLQAVVKSMPVMPLVSRAVPVAAEHRRILSSPHQSAEPRALNNRLRRRLRTHNPASTATTIALTAAPSNASTGSSLMVGPDVHSFATTSTAPNTTIAIANFISHCAFPPPFHARREAPAACLTRMFGLVATRSRRSAGRRSSMCAQSFCVLMDTGL